MADSNTLFVPLLLYLMNAVAKPFWAVFILSRHQSFTISEVI
jgi:hypothetical protein